MHLVLCGAGRNLQFNSSTYCLAVLLCVLQYPQHMQAVVCCLEAYADVPAVTTPLLKFMSEFVFNKSQRLTFDSSSANGILLFREVGGAPEAGWWWWLWVHGRLCCWQVKECRVAAGPLLEFVMSLCSTRDSC